MAIKVVETTFTNSLIPRREEVNKLGKREKKGRTKKKTKKKRKRREIALLLSSSSFFRVEHPLCLFLWIGHPSTSSSGQGMGKLVLANYNGEDEMTMTTTLAAGGRQIKEEKNKTIEEVMFQKKAGNSPILVKMEQ